MSDLRRLLEGDLAELEEKLAVSREQHRLWERTLVEQGAIVAYLRARLADTGIEASTVEERHNGLGKAAAQPLAPPLRDS
jgi:hypothetical protein